MQKILFFALILLLIVLSGGCTSSPDLKNVKIEILPAEGIPEGTEVWGHINGSKEGGMMKKDFTVTIPGSIEFKAKPCEVPFELVIIAVPHRIESRVYLEGKEISRENMVEVYTSEAAEYRMNFILKEEESQSEKK